MADSFGATSGDGWQDGVETLRQGRAVEAMQQLSAFVEANPNSFEGHNFLGVALAQNKRNAEAIAHLQQALGLNPQSVQAHHNLGLVYLGDGQNDNARDAFTKALQLDSNHAAARQALAALPVSTGSSSQSMSTADTAAMASPAAGLEAASPWAGTSWAGTSSGEPASSTTAVLSAARLNNLDMLKAFIFGLIATVAGAVIWDKVTYYSNYQIGFLAIGVGYCVGLAVSAGAGHKPGTALQIMGALLACFGMLLGQVLIVFDAGRDQLAQSHIIVPWLKVLQISFTMLPEVLKENPLTLIFIAIGVYQGWSIPGNPRNTPGSEPTHAAASAPDSAGDSMHSGHNTGQ